MKTIKVLWGLLVDDGRLATTLIVALLIAFAASAAGYKTIAAIIIWAGLVVSLWVSTRHQLKVKK